MQNGNARRVFVIWENLIFHQQSRSATQHKGKKSRFPGPSSSEYSERFATLCGHFKANLKRISGSAAKGTDRPLRTKTQLGESCGFQFESYPYKLYTSTRQAVESFRLTKNIKRSAKFRTQSESLDILWNMAPCSSIIRPS